MPYIKVDVSKFKSYQQEINDIKKKVSSVSDDMEYVRKKLDSSVKSKNGIDNSLKNINNSLNSYENVLKKMGNFLESVPEKYKKVEKDINSHIKQKSHIEAAWFKLINMGPPMFNPFRQIHNTVSLLKTGAKIVVGGWSKIVSAGKKSWEEKGLLYKIVKGVGAAVTVVSSVATIVGAVLGTGITAGLGAPVTALVATYALNQAISGMADLYNICFGDVEKVGEVNLLKSGITAVTGEIGSWFGNEDAGKTVGDVVYTIGSVSTLVITFSNSWDKMVQGKTAASTFTESWKKTKKLVTDAGKELPYAVGQIGYFLRQVPLSRLAYEAKLFSYAVPNLSKLVSEINLVKGACEDAKDLIDKGVETINIIAGDEIVEQPVFLDKLEDVNDLFDKIKDNPYEKIKDKFEDINDNIKLVKLVI